jgi:diaminohydroxyphosphoribosylaminopyrimidine deaminase/5-amino-6-(5-phosphoribosylamino)uracil reductase
MSSDSGCCTAEAQCPVYLCPVDHQHFMQRSIDLAQLGLGSVAPNPMVGCVIVLEGKIIGEGCHRIFGGPHAEVEAVASVEDKSLLRSSVMYVSLEPCAHFGKTPPCANLIVEMGILEVHIATLDPFAKVSGRGVALLREAGVNVHVGLLEHAARALNRRFLTFHERKRPYVILKWAETADGFVDSLRTATEQPASITGKAANVLSHTWRAQEAAVMVGTGTALLDDPSLTVRNAAGRNPLRIVLDREGRISPNAKLLDQQAETLILNEQQDFTDGLNRWVRLQSLDDLNEVMTMLWRSDVQSILVEGGPALHGRFVETGLWDEARRYVSTDRLNTGVSAVRFPFNPEEIMQVGDDQLHVYSNHRTA